MVKSRPRIIVQHNRIFHRAAIDTAACATAVSAGCVGDDRATLDGAAIDATTVPLGRVVGYQAIANQDCSGGRMDAAAATGRANAVVQDAGVQNLPAGRVDAATMYGSCPRPVPLNRRV